MSVKRTAKPSRPSDPSQGRANLAALRHVSDGDIARTAPEELRDLPPDFWDEAVPVLPAANPVQKRPKRRGIA